jgi:hypothetical protein
MNIDNKSKLSDSGTAINTAWQVRPGKDAHSNGWESRQGKV